jgi:tRNA-dihydrouridine synthase B
MIFSNYNKPLIALAPMASMTDGPFCKICRQVSGKKFVIFREMVSAEAIVRNNKKSLRMCEIAENEQPIIQQIFGSNPKVLVKAAQIIVKRYQPEGIDVNMGCPVPKIVGKAKSGAALLKDPVKAIAIIKALKQADLGVSISVKTRLGWADNKTMLELAPRLEQAGADFISIHGRTRKQAYSGTANWEMITRIKKRISIPLFANGDVIDNDSLIKCLKVTEAEGIMIGRGALGNPWILAVKDRKNITKKELVKTVFKHAELHADHYGENNIVTFRKHLAYYFKGFEGAKELRRDLVRINNLKELRELLRKFV